MVIKMIYCCECRIEVDARKTSGREIYPHRPNLYNKVMHVCDDCGNYVGSHSSGRPLGCIPTPEIRKERIKIHALLDNIWKSGRATRTGLYKEVGERIGHEFHTANIRTIAECEQIYGIVVDIAKASCKAL